MRLRKTAIAVLSVAAALTASSAYALKSDEVLSQHVREADGTSAQNTNAGAGIKTGHLQNGAVTSAKLADGAVTDAKIAGPISPAKIATVGLDADTVDGKHAVDLAPAVHAHVPADVAGLAGALDGKADLGHSHDARYQQRYAGIVVVAKEGGDFSDPIAAINSITDASATNPYLLKIMPGVYDLGAGSLVMKPHVDVEGSGEHATILKGTPAAGGPPGRGPGFVPPGGAVVRGADSSELRLLTVEHQNWTGILNENASPSIRRVRVITHGYSGGDDSVTNVSIGNLLSNAVLREVSIESSGYDLGWIYNNIALYNQNSSTTISDTRIHMTGPSGFAVYLYRDSYGDLPIDVLLERVTVSSPEGYIIGVLASGSDVVARGCSIDVNGGVAIQGGGLRLVDSTVRGPQVLFNVGTMHIENSQLSTPTPAQPWHFILSNNYLAPGAATYLNNVRVEGNFLTYYGGLLRCLNVYDGEFLPVACPQP